MRNSKQLAMDNHNQYQGSQYLGNLYLGGQVVMGSQYQYKESHYLGLEGELVM